MQVADDRSIAYSLAQERLEQLQFRYQTLPNQPIVQVDANTGNMWKAVVPVTTTTYTSLETLLTDNTTDSKIIEALHDTKTNKTVTNMRNGKVVNRTFTRSTMAKIYLNNTPLDTRLVQIRVTVGWVDTAGNAQHVDMVTYYSREI